MNNNATSAIASRKERLSRLGILYEPLGYVDGANVYEYERNSPATGLDPLGTQTQPGPGEGWVDPGNPGAGIYRNPDDPSGANCLGRACGRRKPYAWKYNDGYIPQGCELVDCNKVPKKNDCNKDEVILVVSIFRDRNNPDNRGFHVIYRDGNTPDGEWRGKLGGDPASDRAEDLQNSGVDVRGITDANGHFSWYWKGMTLPEENPEITQLCFRCDKTKMRPDPTDTFFDGK